MCIRDRYYHGVILKRPRGRQHGDINPDPPATAPLQHAITWKPYGLVPYFGYSTSHSETSPTSPQNVGPVFSLLRIPTPLVLPPRSHVSPLQTPITYRSSRNISSPLSSTLAASTTAMPIYFQRASMKVHHAFRTESVTTKSSPTQY